MKENIQTKECLSSCRAMSYIHESLQLQTTAKCDQLFDPVLKFQPLRITTEVCSFSCKNTASFSVTQENNI